MRIRFIVGGLVVCAALAAGPASASPEFSGTPTVTLDINPHGPLADTQSITATGAGFTSGGSAVSGTLKQCVVDPAGFLDRCSNSLANFVATAPGSFNQTVEVRRIFTPDGGSPVDCGVTACQLEAESFSGSHHSKHSLDFAGPIRTLTVTKSGSGTVSGSGIDCGSDCSHTYNHATPVTLTAIPASGQVFSSWSGCDSTSGNTCTLTMNANKSVQAVFAAEGSGGGGGAGGETCSGLTATIAGTQDSETLTGTAGRDVIAALGGNDVVKGGAGNDVICGGAGTDTLKGGAGKDKLLGDRGKDRLSGGAQKDTCNGGAGKDQGSACEKGPDS